MMARGSSSWPRWRSVLLMHHSAMRVFSSWPLLRSESQRRPKEIKGGCVVFRVKVRPVGIVIERAEPITGFVVDEPFCDIAEKKKKVMPRQTNIALSASVFLSILSRVE
ncbi:MAG: hypothetical protein OSB73_17500 [Candidatus Latescibacteria bacterium]|nr:hypothetical protein [Candidatus Latescibacterota bacterium]